MTSAVSHSNHQNQNRSHQKKSGRNVRRLPTTRVAGRVMLAPGVSAFVRSASPARQPSTRLGRLAQRLVDQTVVTTLNVAAVSGYVYALTQANAPLVTFSSTPPGMNSSQLAQLQDAYSTFINQFSVFQGQAGGWITTQAGSGAASIFSQLVSVPNTLNLIDGTVQGYFTILGTLQSGSSQYNATLTKLESLVGAEQPAITSLVQSMTQLGSTLANSSSTLIASTQSGVLAQMLAAYAADIAQLQSSIQSAQQQIGTDNAKISGEGVGAAASLVTGLVGLSNFWNPLGWVLMAAGAVGAYFAISEIELLKAETAKLLNDISTATATMSEDERAAASLSSFVTMLQGLASMNTSAQAELLALESLYTTLGTEITQALADLANEDLSDAQSEWTTILSGASVLKGLTAYLWPSPTMVSAPTVVAPVGGDVYYVATSGEVFHFASATASWADMGVTALSCVAAGATILAIDGAPIDGSALGANTAMPTYFVKMLDVATGIWKPISTFPASAVATDGTSVYAVNQLVNDRQVYVYGGSGTTWTALPALPGPDAASQIAVAGGSVFALTNNSQLVYQYVASSSTWTQVGSVACASIAANGSKLGMVDVNLNAYLFDPTAQTGLVSVGTGVIQLAQLASGNQYRIGSDLSLWLLEATDPPSYTQVASNATGVFAGDTGNVYYSDNLGNFYALNSNGQATLMPAIP